MYNKYFGINEAPFSISPNPRYLFMSRRHKEALAHLIYGISHGGGFVLLSGEVGTGKTTVSRSLIRQLPKNADVAYILNASLSEEELLATICQDLGMKDIPEDSSLKTLTDKLHRYLLDNYARGRTTLLIIDEAQHLQFSVLEQIRLLTNLETDERKLLQIVLIGQPELNELLSQQRLRQLSQRITARFHIEPLDLSETESYIRHRLMVAGLPANQTLFNRAAVKRIHSASKGIPRLINVICDRALLGAYTQNASQVDKSIAVSAIEEAMGHTKNQRRALWPFAVISLAITLFVVAGVFVFLRTETPPLPPVAVSESQAIAPQPTVAEDLNSSEPVLIQKMTKSRAINSVQQHLGVSALELSPACGGLEVYGVYCYELTVNSWLELKDLNRPTLIRLDGFDHYVPVLGISSGEAQLLGDEGLYEIPLFELGALWTGEAVILWKPPAAFSGAIELGSRSELVGWVARYFAAVDGQPEPLADTDFNEPLEQRVAIFQRSHGLEADGIVGLKTVLKINDALGTDFSMLNGREG